MNIEDIDDISTSIAEITSDVLKLIEQYRTNQTDIIELSHRVIAIEHNLNHDLESSHAYSHDPKYSPIYVDVSIIRNNFDILGQHSSSR